MADATKARRLLAAKKKVKEYQKSKKNKPEAIVDSKTPLESLTNSTHSSLTEVQNLDENDTYNQSVHSVSPLQQYFTGGNSTIFDDINSKNKNNDFYSYDLINYNLNSAANKASALQRENDQHLMNSSEYVDLQAEDMRDSIAVEDPEINLNEIYNRLNSGIPQENKLNQSPFSEDNTVNVVDSKNVYSTDNVSNVKENMQSLKQLSTQIIQLIDENALPMSINKTSNIEMESNWNQINNTLQIERDQNRKVSEEVNVQKAHITQLEKESHSMKEDNEKYALEVKHLSEQIQCHQQTVNILVAEKSELTNLLSQNEATVKQKTTECDELSARLKTSRSRVADLEKELTVFRAHKQDRKVFEEGLNEDYQKLLKECQSLQNQREEIMQDVSELQEKLTTSTSDNLKLKHDVQELTSQLSLSNIKLQQLSSGVDHQYNGHLEASNQQINMYEKQVIDLNNIIKTLTIEKEQTSVQYQQYVQQLTEQLNALVQRLDVKTQENETLVSRENQLTNQMGELEKLLQKLQSDQQVVVTRNGNGVKKELEETMSSLQAVQQEKSLLEESCQLVISERDDAFKELEFKKEEVNQLEEEINRLHSNQPDNVKLLATIESDKVAASRAVTQNTELKKQLEEIQQAFIQISNNKLELTELLNDQKHKNKDLNDKLNQFESQVHMLTDAIMIKDREMVSLRETAQEVNKYVVQHNQLEDRLRHYEAHDHSTHALQHELQESYKRIQNLRSENETLKFHLKNAENKNKEFQSTQTTQESGIGEDKMVLLAKIEDLERRNREIESKLQQVQPAELNGELSQSQVEPAAHEIELNTLQAIPTSDPQSEEHRNQQMAMKQLEVKFTKTMKEIADLEDEKQRLEHLVMQLQDETETIGEYVTLYQHQRGILKQRASERDEQMRQLTVDREQMKVKIDRLNELVKALVLEKGSVSPEMLDQHLINKRHVCEEHIKINQDVPPPFDRNGIIDNDNKTAEKIIELLCDIKTSNLVQPSEMTETFHPCPWCSGQLITV